MKRSISGLTGKIIGTQLRFLSGAIAFGVWQNSFAAGLAFYMLLVTVDVR